MMNEDELSHYIYALYCNDKVMSDDDLIMSYDNFTDDLRYEQIEFLLVKYHKNDLLNLFNIFMDGE